jgi:hypothetical protein
MAKLARAALDIELDKLAAWVPVMLDCTAETEQMDAFAGMAELVEEAATPDDLPHVHDRLQRILSDNCMVPSDEGPCA